MNTIEAVDARVDKLEMQITAGFAEIKALLKNEITELKTEQLTDLREMYKRLADDQRRSWDDIHALQNREAQRYGGERKLGAIGGIFTGALGGLVSAVATYLSIGKH